MLSLLLFCLRLRKGLEEVEWTSIGGDGRRCSLVVGRREEREVVAQRVPEIEEVLRSNGTRRERTG